LKIEPLLTFWQLWNMSFGYVGIQFGFALQNANFSRISETLGAKVENIAILWIAAPVAGLLVQPIIRSGHDPCRCCDDLCERQCEVSLIEFTVRQFL